MSHAFEFFKYAEVKFKVLVADPPWPFSDPLPGASRGAGKNYKLQVLEAIKSMRLPQLADDAMLFLWRVSSQVPEAYEVVKAWGFEHKTEIVWQKLTKSGKRWFGMGRTLRATHETAIVATRGKPEIKLRNIRSVIPFGASEVQLLTPSGVSDIDIDELSMFMTAPVPTDGNDDYLHSGKPEEFHTIIESLTPGPYAEMYARRHHPGWACFGDQLPLLIKPVELKT